MWKNSNHTRSTIFLHIPHAGVQLIVQSDKRSAFRNFRNFDALGDKPVLRNSRSLTWNVLCKWTNEAMALVQSFSFVWSSDFSFWLHIGRSISDVVLSKFGTQIFLRFCWKFKPGYILGVTSYVVFAWRRFLSDRVPFFSVNCHDCWCYKRKPVRRCSRWNGKSLLFLFLKKVPLKSALW